MSQSVKVRRLAIARGIGTGICVTVSTVLPFTGPVAEMPAPQVPSLHRQLGVRTHGESVV